MRSIKFLRFFFFFCFIMSIPLLFLGGIGYILNLFFDMGPMFKIYYSGVAHITTNAAYSLMGGGSFTGDVDTYVKIRGLVTNTFPYRLFALINFSILMTGAVVSLKYLINLFGNFGEAKEWTDFFTRANYNYIKKGAVLALIVTSYLLLKNYVLSWYLIQDTVIFGESTQFHPAESILSAFIPVFILFGVARVFKAAIEMKEESEFTI